MKFFDTILWLLSAIVALGFLAVIVVACIATIRFMLYW